jgi:type I restriction enzyme M protein
MERTIDYIRNIFRSSNAISGMDSINHCIIFVTFRMLTPELCKTIGIDESLSFHNAIHDKNGEVLGPEELYSKFYCKGNKDLNVVGQIVNKIGFTNFKYRLEGSHDLKKIIIKLKELDIEYLAIRYDIIGTIYELHLKSGTVNARDLGQFYTHRLVIKYMIELCDPKIINGVLETIVDPTMGTAGFLTMSIKYLNDKYPKGINWAENKNKIIGFDIDDHVKNMALINVFLELGSLCNDTIVRQDTLRNGLKFPMSGKILEKADIILANEPMGIKGIKYEQCCEQIKNVNIKGIKAEPLFMHLFMETLADGGRCGVIVPDGVLFNESNQHVETRKYLIENFNLKKVISLKDSNFFLNTGVKTSILFFTKDKHTTKNVEFCEITINDKDEIVETIIITVLYKDIKINEYSLSVNKYNIEYIEKIEGLRYEKLGDVIKSNNGGEVIPKQYWNKGDKILYTCCQNYFTTNFDKFPVEKLTNVGDLLLPRNGSGIPYVKRPLENSLYSNVVQRIEINTLICNSSYVYYFLNINIDDLIKKVNIGTIPSYNFNIWKSLEIPIPSISVQNAIVERLDFLTETNNTLKLNIEQLKTTMKYYVENTVQHVKQIEKMGNVCDFKNGKSITKSKLITGKYPVIGGGQSPMGYHEEYNRDENTILCSSSGAYAGFISKYKEKVFASDCFSIKPKSTLSNNYLFYFLKNIQNSLYKYQTGSAQPHFYSSCFENIEIPIPSIEIQNALVEYCDNITNMIQLQEKQIESNKELMKNIMNGYLSLCEEANKVEEAFDNEEEVDYISDNEIDYVSDAEESFTVKHEDEKLDLSKLSVNKLRSMCKEKNLGPYSKLKKVDLISLLTSSKK